MFILLIIISKILFSVEEYKLKVSHYDVANYNMRIVEIADDELVFYGENGGVLRTYDGGQTWYQTYAGTSANITKMIYENNTLFAVTFDGEFMYSTDKGKLWNVKKITDESLSSIAIDGGVIYVGSIEGSIFAHSVDVKSWNKIKQFNKILFNLIYFDGNLFAHLIDTNSVSTLQVLKKDKTEFENYPLHENATNSSFKIRLLNNQLYLATYTGLFYLKSENNWEWNWVGSPGSFDFTTKDNKIFNLVYTSPQSSSIAFFTFDIETKEKKLIKEHRFIGLGYPDYFVNDLVINDDDLYISMPGKTIIKTTNEGMDYQILSSYSKKEYPIPRLIYTDKDNWVLPRDGNATSKGSANFIKTTNGGKTFQIEESSFPIDTVGSGNPTFPTFAFVNFIDKNNGAFGLLGNGGKNVYMHRYGKTNDGGKTIEFSDDTVFVGTPALKIYDINNFYLTTTSIQTNKIRFYIMNDNMDMELIGAIDSVKTNNLLKYFDDGKSVWAYGQDLKAKKFILAKYDSTIKNFKNIYRQDLDGWSGNGCNFFQQGNRFFVSIRPEKDPDLKIYEINLEKDTLDLFYSSKLDKNPNVIFENIIPISTDNYYFYRGDVKETLYINYYRILNGNDTSDYFYNVVKLDFQNKLQIDTLYNFNLELSIANRELLKQQLTNNFKPFYTSYLLNMYVPIEDEEVDEHYNSVESESQISNKLKIQTPFPQPSRSEVRFKIAWDNIKPLNLNDIEVYDINGELIDTKEQMSFEEYSSSYAKIIWDNTITKSGIYYIKVKLGDETATQKILVIK